MKDTVLLFLPLGVIFSALKSWVAHCLEWDSAAPECKEEVKFYCTILIGLMLHRRTIQLDFKEWTVVECLRVSTG